MDILEKNKDITDLSNYKTPAQAWWFFEISTQDDVLMLSKMLEWTKQNNVQILWISGGTNMLFAFDVFEGLVIKNSLS